MTDFTKTDSGLIVPATKPEPKQDTRDGFPVKAGWHFSKCGRRYVRAQDQAFRMNALEDLYIAVHRDGRGIPIGTPTADPERCERLLNELAVELVGGVPDGWEEYT